MPYADIERSLSETTRKFLDGAKDEGWNYLHEPQDAFAPDWVKELRENIDALLKCENINSHTKEKEWEVVKKCLDEAVEEKLWPEAMAAALVLDRFMYRNDRNDTYLLEKVSFIQDNCSDLHVPLQIRIRQVRRLRDDGLLLSADQRLDDLMAQATSSETTDDQLTYVRCLYIKSEIELRLGQWYEAVHSAVKAVNMTSNFQKSEPKLMAVCLQQLCNSLRNISPDDYEDLRQTIAFEEDNPYKQAFVLNRHAAYLVGYDAFLFARHEYNAARDILQYCFLRTDRLNPDERSRCLKAAMKCLTLSLKAQGSKSELKKNDQLFDYANCFHHLGIVLKEQGLTDLYRRVGDISKKLYLRFNEESSLDPEFEELINGVLKDLDVPEISDKKFELIFDETEEEERSNTRYPYIKQNAVFEPRRKLSEVFKMIETAQGNVTRVEDQEVRDHSTPVSSYGCPAIGSYTVIQQPPSAGINMSSKKAVLAAGSCSRGGSETVFTDPVLLPGENPIQDVIPVDSTHFSAARDARCVLFTHKLHCSEENAGMGVINVQNESTPREHGEMREGRNCFPSGVYDAFLVKFRALDKQWTYEKTLVYVGNQLELEGGFRKLVEIRYLHQQDNKAMHAGKYFKENQDRDRYLAYVVRQEVARHYLREFCRDLQKSFAKPPRLEMLSVAHLQILDDAGHVIQYFNVEPYIREGFEKITDARGGLSSSSPYCDLMTAFSHDSWQKSEWKFMFMDLQGWAETERTNSPDSRLVLTDPGIHTVCPTVASLCEADINYGRDGFRKLWEKAHKKCRKNKYCNYLKLDKNPPPIQ